MKFLLCDSFFERDCSVARYLGVKIDNRENRTSINCNACVSSITKAQSFEKFESHYLRKYFGLTESNIFGEELSLIRKSPIDYQFRGIPMGKIAAYEIILEFKKKDFNFTEAETDVLVAYTENCLRVFLAGRKFLEANLPDRVVMFNPQYGVNSAFCAAAESLDIRVDGLAFSNVLAEMRSYVRIWNWTKYRNVTPGRFTADFKKVKVTRDDKLRLRRNSVFIQNATSPWTYSQPANDSDVRQLLNISREKKILLAVMNSLDEQFAAVTASVLPESFGSMRVFENQDEWIKSLIDYCRDQTNLVLVIRLHPREFPNKRESVTAEATQSRSALFEDLPENIRLDHPFMKIPIENYFHEVTAITTGWSSVGLDWQIRGIGCVTYDANLPMYPEESHITGHNKEQYFQNLTSALTKKTEDNPEPKIHALKWYVYSQLRGTARLGASWFDEAYTGNFLRKLKFTGVLNRYFPELKSWLDFNTSGMRSGKKRIISYFQQDLDSLHET